MPEGHEQAHSADIFIEPHVHPDVDSYFRDKLAPIIALKTRLDASRAYRGKFDNSYPVGQGRVMLDEHEAALLERTTPEAEIQRLQSVWRAAAVGDFAGVNTEVAQDISRVTNEVTERRNSPFSGVREDVERYDTSVAELAEWQASLQETPVDATSRLGKQINKTVVNLIHQRDNTSIGRLNKQLTNLQRIQKAVPTPSHVSTGK